MITIEWCRQTVSEMAKKCLLLKPKEWRIWYKEIMAMVPENIPTWFVRQILCFGKNTEILFSLDRERWSLLDRFSRSREYLFESSKLETADSLDWYDLTWDLCWLEKKALLLKPKEWRIWYKDPKFSFFFIIFFPDINCRKSMAEKFVLNGDISVFFIVQKVWWISNQCREMIRFVRQFFWKTVYQPDWRLCRELLRDYSYETLENVRDFSWWKDFME